MSSSVEQAAEELAQTLREALDELEAGLETATPAELELTRSIRAALAEWDASR